MIPDAERLHREARGALLAGMAMRHVGTEVLLYPPYELCISHWADGMVWIQLHLEDELAPVLSRTLFKGFEPGQFRAATDAVADYMRSSGRHLPIPRLPEPR